MKKILNLGGGTLCTGAIPIICICTGACWCPFCIKDCSSCLSEIGISDNLLLLNKCFSFFDRLGLII